MNLPSSKKLNNKFLKLLWYILDSEAKKDLALIVLLVLINSVIEFLGLASIIPAIVALKDPDAVYQNQVLHSVFENFGFQSHQVFVLFLFLFVLVLFLFKGIVSVWINKYNTLRIFKISTQLSRKVLSIIFLKPFLFFKSTNSSNLYRQLNSYPTLFGSQIILPFSNIISESFIILLIFISILTYDYKVFLIVAIVNIPIVYFFNRIYRKRVKFMGAKANEGSINLVRTFQNIVHGFVDIKMFNRDEHYQRIFSASTEQVNKLTAKSTVLSLIPTRILEISAIFALIVIFASSFFLSTSDDMIFATISLYVVAAYRIMPSLAKIMQATLSIRNNSYAIVFLYKILKSERPFQSAISSIEFNEEIELARVSWKYGSSINYALDNLNLRINKGEVIGVIGDSGSGKSTLVNILLGFIEPIEGTFKVDGTTVNFNNAKSWRSHIGYVRQDTFLFDTSIAENIAVGKDIQDIDIKKIEYCIDKAHLREFINEQKNGIYTQVGEMGGRVSGGQKQRLGIARSLYNDPDVLIFDEST